MVCVVQEHRDRYRDDDRRDYRRGRQLTSRPVKICFTSVSR